MCIKSTAPILKKTQTQSQASSWSVQGLHTGSAVSFPVMATPGIHPHGHALLSSLIIPPFFHVRFKNSYKKKTQKLKKKESTFFLLLYLLFVFLHFQPQNSCKKDKNAKNTKIFKFAKKVENNISKKNMQKKIGGVYHKCVTYIRRACSQ